MVLSRTETNLANFAEKNGLTYIGTTLRDEELSLDDKIVDIRGKISTTIIEDYRTTLSSARISHILTASLAALFLSASLVAFLPESLLILSSTGFIISGAFSCYYTMKRYGINKKEYDKAKILDELQGAYIK